MTDSTFTQLMLIVDRSSSMVPIADDMNGSIHNLLKEQSELPGKLRVDVTTFASDVRFDATDQKVKKIERDLVQPNGMTALNDAIALSIQRLGDRLAAMDENERPGKVIVAIVTDGGENESHEFPGVAGRDKVKAMVEKQQNEFAWEFIFFGVGGIDKVATQSAGYGVTRGSTMSYEHNVIGTQAFASAASGYMTKSRISGEKIDISVTQPPTDDKDKKTKS